MNCFTTPANSIDLRNAQTTVCNATRGSSSSSLVRIHIIAALCALSLLSTGMLFVVQPAMAATWPVPTSRLSATLDFHESYTAGINSYVHSGIDIPASAGMQISAPAAGRVRFTGAVPSGDSKTSGTAQQKTMNAVSIEMQSGKIITLMPFSTTQVKEGQLIIEGQSLGTLAASGDSSTAGTHLHVGYKDGQTYLDPMQLFGVFQQAKDAADVGAVQAIEGAAIPALDLAPVFQESPIAEAPSLQGQTESSLSGQEVPEQSFNTIETGAYALKERSVQTFLPLKIAADAFYGLGAACADQLACFVGALSALSKGTGIPLQVLIAAVSVLSISALIALVALSIKCFGPHIIKFMSRFKRAPVCGAVEKYSACH